MRSRWIVTAAFAVIGLVWVGQGLGLLRGSSFMVDDVRWAIAGAGLVVVAAILAVVGLRGRAGA